MDEADDKVFNVDEADDKVFNVHKADYYDKCWNLQVSERLPCTRPPERTSRKSPKEAHLHYHRSRWRKSLQSPWCGDYWWNHLKEICLFKYLNIYCMEQTFRWNKEMIPKIFEQILEQVFGRNKKVFAQIVFQPYLNFNNAHTRFVPAGLILFCNPFWFATFCSSSSFWAFWRFEERGQIWLLLVSWEVWTKLCWCSIIILEIISRLTFLEFVKAEVTNPPGLHIEVGQRCLIGWAEADDDDNDDDDDGLFL